MPRRRRRSWAGLLWTGVCFLALQLLVGASIESHLLSVRDSEYTDKEAALRARLAENPGRPLTLVLGSSRTLLGLRAADVSGDEPLVFNFGLQGAGPLRQWIVYQRLRAAGIRPDAVFVEVLPPLFNQTGGHNQEEWWLQGDRLSLSELRQVSAWHTNPTRLMKEWVKSRGLPTLRHAGGLCRAGGLDATLAGTADGEKRYDGHGWLSMPTENIGTEDIKTCTENARRQYAATLRDFRLAAGASAALEHLLSACRRDGVTVTLFLMPEGSVFRSWCPPGMVAGYEKWLDELCRRRGLALVDGRTWVADDGFWDGHHLLPSGAEEFTRRWRAEAMVADPGARRAASSLP